MFSRLSRLLHKHKFEEAENFAIQFGLDVEVVFLSSVVFVQLCFDVYAACETQLLLCNPSWQLVYKVKLDFVLEKLASASVGGYGQEVWSELVEEAKTNLMKIMVRSWAILMLACKELMLISPKVKLVGDDYGTDGVLLSFHAE